MDALFSVFAVILAGWCIRRWSFVPDAFWPQLESVIYYILFPALLFANTAAAKLEGLDSLPMGASVFLAVLATAALLWLSWPIMRRFGVSGPAFTSVFQGGIRPNTFVGLATVGAMHGEPGLTLAAVAIMAEVPLVNLLCVGTLCVFGAQQRTGFRMLGRELVRNPLLLSVVLGFVWNATGLPLPSLILDTLRLVGAAALPMGLMAVGAGLSLRGLRAGSGAISVSLAFKLFILPALCLGAMAALDVQGLARDVAQLFTIIPCAPSAYILARKLGGDEELMAAVITLGILAAALTMPLWLTLTG